MPFFQSPFEKRPMRKGIDLDSKKTVDVAVEDARVSLVLVSMLAWLTKVAF
jgi:hypothetical protein